MKAVDFYKLPRSIQDRFVGSVMSGFPPAPLLAVKGGASTKMMWLGLSGGCFLGLVIVARLGYGGLDSALALHSAKVLPLYAALLFGLAFGLVMAFARLVRERALPYTAGIYLFPACLIDARHDQFKLYETRDLQNVDVQGNAVRVSFAGGAQFLFPLGPEQQGQAIVDEINAARDRSMHAHATEDPKELVAVDPLHNPRFSSPVGPRDAYALKYPPWGKFGWGVALGVAVILGPTLWALRNLGSDKKMYALATQEDNAESYRNYLEHGSRFKDEVAGILLPRAELRTAIAQNSVDALLKYKEEHPSSQISSEVQTAIHAAMLAELEKAKAAGTLKALQDFAKKYPEHGVQKELDVAIHAVYARELDAYKKVAPQKDKNATAFIERLFAWGEKHGPKVEIRFRHKVPSTLERADQHILKLPTFMGVITYPSRFFDDKRQKAREAVWAKNLSAAIDAGLAAELFEVSVGQTVPMDADALPDVKDPTLFIAHAPEWSGHTYNTSRPRGTVIGIQFNYEATWVIPGDPKPYKYKDMIFRHGATYALKDDEPMLPTGEAEEKVYNTMSDEAFERFSKAFLANFFKPADKKD